MEITSIQLLDVDTEADRLIQQMDQYGIEKAVLSSPDPFEGNDLYKHAAEIFPDRLYYAISIIPRPSEKAQQMLIENIECGAKALIMDDALYYHNDPAAHVLVQLAIESEIPVYFRSTEMGVHTLGIIDSFSLMYPEGKFVLTHMGGLFSFPRAITLAHRDNVWFDTSHTLIRLVESPMRTYLDAMVQDVGIRKLVFGSGHHSEYADLQAALNMVDINIEQNQIITKKNAEKLLNL